MSKYRGRLPQLRGELFLTDGGIETTLVFHEGVTLPCFASFDLLKDETGTAVLRRYFERYAELARSSELGLVLETPTWRANADWGAKLGHAANSLADVNRRSVALLLDIRREYETSRSPIVISGNLGPRGDGYSPGARMSAAEAEEYHAPQIEVFAGTEADMVAAFTMNYPEEAVGIVRAAKAAKMPVAISFTTETDGRLPSGADAEGRDRGHGRCLGRVSGVLHDQLRPSDPSDRGAGGHRWLARPHSWSSRERLAPQPQGAGREPRPGRGKPRGAGAGISGATWLAAGAVRGGRLLRNRPPPRRSDRPGDGRRGGGDAAGLTQTA